MRRLTRAAFCFILLLAPVLAVPAAADRTPYDWAYIDLDYVCSEKVEQLKRFIGRMHKLASAVAEDEAAAAFFDMNLQYEKARRQGDVPASLTADITGMRENFDQYYIRNYLSFYDMLFIGPEGRVFYTLRGESDIGSDLTAAPWRETPLGACVAGSPAREVFIDFHHYGPSGEPAAFFVEPVFRDGRRAGWIALQLAVNKLNSLFASTRDLGRTGETFLVNEEGLMLTESYFRGHSTILKTRLDDRNVRAKFRDVQGRLEVTDYRGARALSSFQVVEFMDVRWLVVAKVDKDEIATEHYLRHHRYYADQMLHRLPAPAADVLHQGKTPRSRSALRVDMDEFVKADEGQRLETWGLSTCTGVLAFMPDRFAYLAHISPQDRVYGGRETNLLGQVCKKMQSFDIYPSEKRGVIFVVVAPRVDSLAEVVRRLAEEGFLLSQIYVFHHPRARTGSIVYDQGSGDLRTAWRMPGGERLWCGNLEDAVNVGRLVEEIMCPDTGDCGAGGL